ncbi:MAG: hypothetical protein AAF682_26150 [Planctomycetota bacterium]
MVTLPLLFGSADVPRYADVVAQLAHARERRMELRGKTGAARSRAREGAVAAYRAVRKHHPRERAAVAESAFRAGELLRAAGCFDEAAGEFRLAVQEGEGTPYRVRGRLELGHVLRRAGEEEAALDAYLAVVADDGACSHRRDEALLWTGRVHAEARRDSEARRVWTRVAREGEDPLDRIRAYDELGLLWIRRGDAEAAAGVWNQCRSALADDALEQTERGTRVRGALERMRTLRELRRVVRERGRPPKFR